MNPKDRLLGIIDQQVVVAGICGGIARGLVEGPFEYIKGLAPSISLPLSLRFPLLSHSRSLSIPLSVRRQVHQPWKITEIFRGSGATIFRNAFLFGSFVVYIDISKQLIPGGLSPFWSGAICANLAWLTVWPMDVAKSQLQSGNYAGKSFVYLVRDVITSGKLFRGLIPGLTRSTIANGCGMFVYKKIENGLTEWEK